MTIGDFLKWCVKGYLKLVAWYVVIVLGVTALKGISLCYGVPGCHL